MKNILPEFIVNEETLIILPSKQIEYDAIVIQMEETYHVAKTPMQIIKESCLRYNSTYEGRRKAIISNTYYRRMVPIPMCDQRSIYTFPTHATNHIDCCWIFYNNILRFNRHQDREGEKVIITFKNELEIVLQMSLHSFERQLGRTYFIKERMLSR